MRMRRESRARASLIGARANITRADKWIVNTIFQTDAQPRSSKRVGSCTYFNRKFPSSSNQMPCCGRDARGYGGGLFLFTTSPLAIASATHSARSLPDLINLVFCSGVSR